MPVSLTNFQITKSSMNQDIAILHDRFPQVGGGEKFAIEAARVLDAPIYTMYISEDAREAIPSDVSVTPLKQSKYRANIVRKFMFKWASSGMNPLESLNVSLDMTDADIGTYDVILESGPLSKSYIPTADQTIVHYPHSPPRWLYDLYSDRLDAFSLPGVKFLIKLYAKTWRALDKESNDYIDMFVANSEIVQKRIKKYYSRESRVVYPPIKGNWRNDSDNGYFVTWSRLVPQKRIDLIAEAFAGLDERLIIAGDGPERQTIEDIAETNQNIEVRGFVEDIESLVANSTAVVYAPQEEDFGMVGAEALLSGKPLLAVNEGFTKYQCKDGETGILFEPTVSSLREAVQRFNPDDFSSGSIQEEATKYRYKNFERELEQCIESAVNSS